MNPIALKIREARIKANMSEKELAKKCAVAPNYIIQIESGKKIINEKTAETILAVFGEKVGFDFFDSIVEEEAAAQKKVEIKKEVVKPDFYDTEPNDQWAGALANIIKKFPIHEVSTDKIVGYRELPILGRKVEGIPWERVLFVRAFDSDMAAVRIKKGDTILVNLAKEIQGKGVYLIEINQKRMIRMVYKETGNKLVISQGLKDEPNLSLEISKVKIIGKCVRVEFDLL